MCQACIRHIFLISHLWFHYPDEKMEAQRESAIPLSSPRQQGTRIAHEAWLRQHLSRFRPPLPLARHRPGTIPCVTVRAGFVWSKKILVPLTLSPLFSCTLRGLALSRQTLGLNTGMLLKEMRLRGHKIRVNKSTYLKVLVEILCFLQYQMPTSGGHVR